jgi:putative protease
MKILAPIRAYDELEMLLESGAEELYCGIVPSEWSERYNGPVWLNRRSPKGSGLETWDEMKRLVDGAHVARVPIFVTLNAPYYSAEQAPLVIELATRLSEEIGVDALIVTDMNLLVRLAEARLRAALRISSVAATLNAEAIRFLLDFGPTRIVLPRSVTLHEIESIVSQVGQQVEIEVFILNDGCAFEEGFCATTHHHSVGAFCTSLSEMETRFDWNGPRFASRREKWLKRISPTTGIGSGTSTATAASPFKKLASVRMVRDIVHRVRTGESKLHVIERAISLRGEPQHCQSGYMCYYKVNA